MTGALRVGTASWTDPTLIKESDFYPKRSMTAEARLRHYASVFSMVEVDATYYHPPNVETVGLWTERTPDNFRMDVKAYSLFTNHPTQPKSLWEDVAADLDDEQRAKRSVYLHALPSAAVDRAWEHFRSALMPLHSAGKLGGVFFQFPAWFRPRRSNRDYLEALAERLPDYQVAVEFRHPSWLAERDRERTIKLLESARLAYVCVDEPQGFDNSVPPVLSVTADMAVIRFHGHNKQNWQRKGITAAERFKYLYSEEELKSWVPKVRAVAEQARETHLVFNNCYRDYGVRNAQEMKRLLTSENTSP